MKPKDAEALLDVAQELFKQSPDWVTFYREIFGVRGAVCAKLPDHNERVEFEQTEQYKAIQKMIVKLKKRESESTPPGEDMKSIAIRCSKAVHKRVENESFKLYTSMNKLAVAKLHQPLNPELLSENIPKDKTISVRMPKSLHLALKIEAKDNHTSVNNLAVAKLLNDIDPELVPSDIQE